MKVCLRHKMLDGTTMVGPIHGPGQVCIQWAHGSSRLHNNKHRVENMNTKKAIATIKSNQIKKIK